MRVSITLIDKTTFFGALMLLAAVSLPLLFYPEQGAIWIAEAKHILTDQFGFLYLSLGVAATLFMVYVVFSDIGQIKLGDADEVPEFGLASWAAMLFCGGIGASILYWGCIEWAYYYQSPPFQLASGSEEAIRWAATYGLFHWGPIAWCIYLIPALPIAYFYYVRKQPVLKVSAALMPVLGEKRSKGLVGKSIDILFIFGLLGGAATTLGLAAPLINQGLNTLFHLPITPLTQAGVLLVCTLIFAYSSFAGLEKGIKLLSNLNFWGAMLLLAFVLVTGPTLFILETGLDSIGRMLSNFFVMATWAEPFGGYGQFEDTHFPQDWTIFYWAWWLVFAPSMGLFVARISRGRTIKQMVSGAVFFGSVGCMLFFIVLGNFGLSLQLEGRLDVVGILQNQGATQAIFAMLGQLPYSNLVIALFTLLCLIFTATTFDSISYILASVVQNNVTEEPLRWNRLFWAFTLSLLPAILMFLGDLSTLQTAAIVGGLPLLVIATLLMASAIKATGLDIRHQEGYIEPTINIEALPSIDPWSVEGMALAKFERLKDIAQQAADNERAAREHWFEANKAIRAYVLDHCDDPQHSVPEILTSRLANCEDALLKAQQVKEQASVNAQLSRADFDSVMRNFVEKEANNQRH